MSSSAIQIRLATKEDAEPVRAIYQPIVEQTFISFEYTTPDTAEIWNRIQRTLEQWPWLVCQIGDQIAGFAYAGPHRSRDAYQWCCELSVYIGDRFQNRKIASALYIT